MSGRKTPRQDFFSRGAGNLSSARIAVLTDEGSASASEIFAGAIQDWDRGLIVGRRTFGKGLVQNGFNLTDGSVIRLTIARYYTPTGRLIQSPYDEGYDKYIENFYKRYTDGELMTADSIHFPDSLKFKTLMNQRIVYGGGGIMPDIFIPADTTFYSDYYRSLIRKGLLNSYSLDYSDKNRARLLSGFQSSDDFNRSFTLSAGEISSFIKKAEEEGVKFNEAQFNISKDEILTVLKALIASNLWQSSDFYRIRNQDDKTIKAALKVIGDKSDYRKILGYR